MTLYDIAMKYNININYLVYLLNSNQIYIQNIYNRLSDADIYRINDVLLRNNIIRPCYNYSVYQKPKNKYLFVIPIVIVVLLTIAILLKYFGTETFKGHDTDISFSTSSPENETGESITNTYTWYYDRKNWSYELEIPESYYDKYKNSQRNFPGVMKFTKMVTEESDDEWIYSITQSFIKIGRKQNYSDSEIVRLIITFVQSIEYQDDKEYTGYDEYPKFPCETLYDNGGDCEDLSILLSSLLQEMGYDAALLDIVDPDKDVGHMAVGLKGTDKVSGKYFTLGEDKYYYVETTASGWPIGLMPDDYEDSEVTVLSVTQGYKIYEP